MGPQAEAREGCGPGLHVTLHPMTPASSRTPSTSSPTQRSPLHYACPSPPPHLPHPPSPQPQVAEVSTSKTGKHGHAKCAFVGIDIFTGKKYEDLSPSSHNVDVPHVRRTDYTLLDVSDDGFVSLLDEKGASKDDLTLPKGTDELEKLAVQIKEDFDAGKELIVSVLAVSGG